MEFLQGKRSQGKSSLILSLRLIRFPPGPDPTNDPLIDLVSFVTNFLSSLPLPPFPSKQYDLSKKPNNIHDKKKMKTKQEAQK